MTVLIGVLCQDGVVVAADSAASFGVSAEVRTIEQPYHRKIVVLTGCQGGAGGQAILATTGAVGQAQRLEKIIQAHCDNKTFADGDPVDIGVLVAKDAAHNFALTQAPKNGVGALLAYQGKSGPALIEFGSADFQPEVKGDSMWWVSMGSGQIIADPTLALLAKGFCSEDKPRLSTGIFMATWALAHVIETNPGGIKEPMHVAVLRADKDGCYAAEMLPEDELGEHLQNVDSIYAYLGKYPGLIKTNDAPDLPQP
jgi:20S proteasome alpha/beta subunit